MAYEDCCNAQLLLNLPQELHNKMVVSSNLGGRREVGDMSCFKIICLKAKKLNFENLFIALVSHKKIKPSLFFISVCKMINYFISSHFINVTLGSANL